MLRSAKHLLSEVDAENIGESDAEISFVGRSNAGKSSLINALCEKKGLAHVSQVPGKTRTVNVYDVRPGRWIVDLPGYGFAVGSKRQEGKLGQVIERYLTSRANLRMVFVILDAVAGPTKLDIFMINWLIHYNYPVNIVVNKIDKVGATRLEERKREIIDQLAVDASDIFWLSARTNMGIDALRKRVFELLEIGNRRTA